MKPPKSNTIDKIWRINILFPDIINNFISIVINPSVSSILLTLPQSGFSSTVFFASFKAFSYSPCFAKAADLLLKNIWFVLSNSIACEYKSIASPYLSSCRALLPWSFNWSAYKNKKCLMKLQIYSIIYQIWKGALWKRESPWGGLIKIFKRVRLIFMMCCHENLSFHSLTLGE